VTPEPDPRDDTASEQQLDTVAQKPTHPQSGAPLIPPANRADLDQVNPTPGAQLPLETNAARITKRPNVAAGLPAIYQATRFAVGEMGLARGATALLKV
jgi:hypothetical protein